MEFRYDGTESLLQGNIVLKETGMDISCEECANFVFDDDEEEYVCCVSMDEDDYIRLNTDLHYQCPYYQCGDEYKIVRHQM